MNSTYFLSFGCVPSWLVQLSDSKPLGESLFLISWRLVSIVPWELESYKNTTNIYIYEWYFYNLIKTIICNIYTNKSQELEKAENRTIARGQQHNGIL